MKHLLLSALCALPVFCMSQTLLYNDGAVVKIMSGATLYVEGGVHNTATGTIDNDGTLEIKGNLLNQGTWEASDPNTLKFSGNVNSDVTSGTALFHNVVVMKDATFNVNLLDHMTVNNNLDFAAPGASRMTIGNFDLKIGASGTVTGYDSDEYVATNGTGMMQKAVTANGAFTFPIGDITNYSPVTSTYSGSAYASANIRTRANDLTHPNKPADATDFISRYWDVNSTGITGYLNTLVGTYIPADVNGTASLIKGAEYDGSTWTYENAAAGANTVTGSVNDGVADFTGTNFFGKVQLVALLQGPYNTSTDLMSITLNTGGLIPLTSPYTDAPVTVGAIPANVTDWVKLELRDPANPATIWGKASAFVKNNGEIIAPDGGPIALIKNGEPTSVVAIHHRNHLAIRTPNAGIDVTNPSVYNFTTSNAQAYTNGAHPNTNMKEVEAGVWAMWAGNANVTGSGVNTIRYSGLNNDNAGILTALGGNSATILNNVYSIADLNMNAVVRYTGLNNDNAVLVSVLNGNSANIWTVHL